LILGFVFEEIHPELKSFSPLGKARAKRGQSAGKARAKRGQSAGKGCRRCAGSSTTEKQAKAKHPSGV